uniref:C2H2-type domain-containing protein n=1 Tax=Toxocara canis TaxID=6265 RepID=A0A183UZ03_TOXCA
LDDCSQQIDMSEAAYCCSSCDFITTANSQAHCDNHNTQHHCSHLVVTSELHLLPLWLSTSVYGSQCLLLATLFIFDSHEVMNCHGEHVLQVALRACSSCTTIGCTHFEFIKFRLSMLAGSRLCLSVIYICGSMELPVILAILSFLRIWKRLSNLVDALQSELNEPEAWCACARLFRTQTASLLNLFAPEEVSSDKKDTEWDNGYRERRRQTKSELEEHTSSEHSSGDAHTTEEQCPLCPNKSALLRTHLAEEHKIAEEAIERLLMSVASSSALPDSTSDNKFAFTAPQASIYVQTVVRSELIYWAVKMGTRTGSIGRAYASTFFRSRTSLLGLIRSCSEHLVGHLIGAYARESKTSIHRIYVLDNATALTTRSVGI